MLTFNGSESTTIPAGALAISDPVTLRVPDGGDLAVSIYLPGSALAATEHSLGLQTTYISPEGRLQRRRLPADGDHHPVLLLPDGRRSGRRPDNPGPSSRSATRSPTGCTRLADANRRWPNRLAERLRSPKGGSQVAVLNAGISGNRILHDMVGTNASARLDRDVLVQSGARYLIVLLGINDIGFPGSPAADEIIAGHRQIIERAHAMGLKVYGGTLTPFQAFLPGIYYTADGEAKRQAVNHWIRTSKAYDAVIDFDKAIRDPGNPAAMRPEYDSGDNLHPNDAGYQAMADAIDLSLFGNAGSGRGAPGEGSVDAAGQAATAHAAAGARRDVLRPAQRAGRPQYGNLVLELQDRRLDQTATSPSPAGSSARAAPQRGKLAHHRGTRREPIEERPHEEVDEIQAVADLAEEAKRCPIEEAEHPAVVRLPQSQHHRQEPEREQRLHGAADA